MNIIDIGMFLIIIVCMLLGYKRGVIKTTVKLVGLIVIGILSYQLKTPIANFLIKHLPFYDFGNSLKGLYSLNILFYNGLAFLFVFVMLYSLLNILILAAGILDKLLKASVILYLPDKILGAIIGFIEGLIISFIIIFVLIQLPFTSKTTASSKYAINILNRTPVIRIVLANTTKSVENIQTILQGPTGKDQKEIDNTNIKILNELVRFRVISSTDVQKLIDENKLRLDKVKFN